MEKCYVFRKGLEKEELIEKYKSSILDDPKFDSEINFDQISIASGFLVYPFIEGNIKNLEYLVLRDNKQKSGVIDASCSLVSKDFLLHELSIKDFREEEHNLDEYNIFNVKDVEVYEKEFIKRILEKTERSICQRHNLILTERKNAIDISPIKTFEELNKKYYLEEVYCFDYFSKKHRKPFKSMYSPLTDSFYSIDFKRSEQFMDFYKEYKRPIVYVPKEYLELYYDMAFRVYISTKEELKYIKPSLLLSKIRKNIKYKEYSKYNDYLNQLIFYFKRKEYLKEFTNSQVGLKKDIFYSYLTLKHNPQSGYHLAELVLNHVVEDNYLKLLDISARQGNTLAKKALFEYYSEPKNYNSY
ncbi:MAG: hypothetical protein K2K50_07060, partial [Anaeroplasmataceae bacterium]|nr:hypothetical protein [Anaeroplasmataceae bacterium]